VGESNVTITELPSSEKRADWMTGGGGTSRGEIRKKVEEPINDTV
jgi:hypothetical protein